MIGVFSYTVILTYISLFSAVTGIVTGFNGNARMAVICLIISAVCDLFDGKIARTKKNRTKFEKDYGVQIDSLNDMISFGILPIIIGLSLNMSEWLYIPVYAIFALTGLIRLGYYNSLVNTSKNSEDEFVGIPITTSAIVCPILFLARRVSGFVYLYPFVLLLLSFLYISKIKVPKPRGKQLYILLGLALLGIILVLFIK